MRLAFVPPRYGEGVLGGAEAVVKEAARGLAERGHQVEVISTCAVDHYTWENELPEGVSEENGLPVRRFRVLRYPSRVALEAQLSIGSGGLPDLDHQVSWLGYQFSSPGLFQYLLRHGDSYDAVVFSPYLSWTTAVCVPFLAERAVVVPCLHDESYARLRVLRPVMAAPAVVWFLSGPEHELAHQLGAIAPHHSVTGAGVVVPHRYHPARFVAKNNLRRPFVIFAGRREGGKGSLEDACVAAEQLGMDVVTIGKGEVPTELANRVIDLGFVSDEERDDALAAATALVQPSVMESFSRTVMEAWLAGTPVVSVAASAVVSWHCRRSGGGLTYSGHQELVEALRAVSSQERAAELAAAGRRYVIENYTWPAVLDRMEASLEAAFCSPKMVAA
ncbi:MAG TPA: glycosyltransferase [Acidimicrobiales bacterium]|nr:glycosyltransferase [Acidimicrobiales bacterium]